MTVGGQRADPVTPAHSHTKLRGEIASPQRATHLLAATACSCTAGNGSGWLVGLGGAGYSVLQCELKLFDLPPALLLRGPSAVLEQEMKYVPFFFSSLIDFPFYH